MLQKIKIMLVMLVIVAPAILAQPQELMLESTKQQIQDEFNLWLTSISSGSAAAVMQLYAKDAILLPTLSAKLCDTPELIRNYFSELTARPHLKGILNEEHIRIFGDIAINSGLYTFTFTAADGHLIVIPARFSFVYHKTHGKWLIIDHHSSRLP